MSQKEDKQLNNSIETQHGKLLTEQHQFRQKLGLISGATEE